MDGSFALFDITGSALEAQRVRASVITRNIANSQVTRTEDGGPFRRQVVRFEEVLDRARRSGEADAAGAVRAVVSDDRRTPFVSIDDPSHPDAVDGRVQYPNVDLATEMVDLVDTSRKYEANLAVLRTWRELMRRTLEITR